jgi:beta-lactamase class C
MLFRFVLLGLFALIFSAPVSSTPNPDTKASGQAPTTPPIETNEFDLRAQEIMSKLEMAGMAVAIVENGKITFAKGYGETVKGSGDLVSADTVFRWASVSKGVAAHVLVNMAREGKLKLDTPAMDLSPTLKLPPSETKVDITHLLSHQIGIVRNAYDDKIEGGRGAKEIRQMLESLPYQCAPATCHTYQNVAYDAATEIVQTLTGLPYKSVVKTDVFDRFGMSTATVSYEGLLQSKSWAKPHGRRGQVIDEVQPTYYRVPAAAGVNSSIKDLARWMTAQMQDEFPGASSELENVQKALQTPLIHTRREQSYINRRFGQMTNAHYGMGFRVYNYKGHKVVGHRGGVEGYRSLILFDPEIRSGIAVMWNSPHYQPTGLQFEFMDQLYGLPKQDWLNLDDKS